MSIINWIVDRISGTSEPTQVDVEEFFNLQAEVVVRNLAFQSAVNLIARSVSKCEFKTYVKNKEVKQREYYLFNVEPNKNQNSSVFIQKWISKLYENNECLIIDNNGQLLVADNFTPKEYALYDYQFTDVTVNDYKFNKTFTMSEVMYLKLNNNDIRKLINAMYESYGKLITYAQKHYQTSKGQKGVLDISTTAKGAIDFQDKYRSLMQEQFKPYFENDNAVLPLFEGYKFTPNNAGSSNETTRDIRATIDDIYDFTARAFGIPPALLRGDMANIEDAVDNYLTFCIDPLCDMLQEEINRKRNGYDGFIQGNFIKIDTKNIKHIDLLEVATSIDKLIASGCFCINDIRKVTGDEIIDEEWAKQHFITKNYNTVEDALNALEGGVKGNEKNVGT